MCNNVNVLSIPGLQMNSDGVFDFLKGGKPISIEIISPIKKETCESDEQLKSEKWTLYTLNIESKSCPLDCLIIHVRTNKTLM